MKIKFIKMKELYKKKDYHGLKLDGLVYEDRLQAVILNKIVPINYFKGKQWRYWYFY